MIVQKLVILSILFIAVRGCIDKQIHCEAWKNAGYCLPPSEYFAYVSKNCEKSCGLCQSACTDKSGYCNAYKKYCNHKDYIDYLMVECKSTCNFCHITTQPPPTTQYVSTQPYTGAGGRTIQPGCGKKGPGHTRIVGGKNAKPGDWPWQVNIDYKYNKANPGHLCGGTLITEEWVLSAAHCFHDDPDKNNYWLKLGEHDLKTNSSWEQRFEIEELLLHPKYNHNTYNNDLALIRLKRKAFVNDRVRTACLPGHKTSFSTGTQCYITGWGYLKEYGTGPAILQQARVPLVEQHKCKKAYEKGGYTITSKMFCAGYEQGGIDACEGDSGGPLVCKHYDPTLKEDIWYLWGTISWGVGCARKGLYGVFASPKVLRPWLDQVVFKGKV